jgi:hypothetical protein
MVSNQRKIASINMGSLSENRFYQAMEKRGYRCLKTDKETDIHQHIDFFIVGKKKNVTVDVKGNNYRNSIWIEFKNVTGKPGWIYGNADYIVFDFTDLQYFIFVDREELLQYCTENVKKEITTLEHCTRKLYTRTDRKDLLTRLELTDLQKIKSFFIFHY